MNRKQESRGAGRPGALAPRAATTIARDDQLLAVLRDADGFPLSTREVCERAGPMAWPPDGATGQRLRALAKAGQVERVTVVGNRQAYWRRTPPTKEDPCVS